MNQIKQKNKWNKSLDKHPNKRFQTAKQTRLNKQIPNKQIPTNAFTKWRNMRAMKMKPLETNEPNETNE